MLSMSDKLVEVPIQYKQVTFEEFKELLKVIMQDMQKRNKEFIVW